jgi:hypothetical protein
MHWTISDKKIEAYFSFLSIFLKIFDGLQDFREIQRKLMSRRRTVSSVPAVALVPAVFASVSGLDGIPTFARIPALADNFSCASLFLLAPCRL